MKILVWIKHFWISLKVLETFTLLFNERNLSWYKWYLSSYPSFGSGFKFHSRASLFPAHPCGNRQQQSCSVLWVCQGHPGHTYNPWDILWGSPPSSGMCFEAVQWCPHVIPVHSCAWYWSPLVNSSTGVFAERRWTPVVVFGGAVSVLCWLGLWDSCLAHLPNGKWHLSWCLLSEGVVSGTWCYWPVSRVLGWLNWFCTSAA